MKPGATSMELASISLSTTPSKPRPTNRIVSCSNTTSPSRIRQCELPACPTTQRPRMRVFMSVRLDAGGGDKLLVRRNLVGNKLSELLLGHWHRLGTERFQLFLKRRHLQRDLRFAVEPVDNCLWHPLRRQHADPEFILGIG